MSWLETFKAKAGTADFTKETLEGFFAEVENDPLSGLGSLTNRDKVIDKIMAQHRIVVSQYKGIAPRQPAPALKEVINATDPLDLKAAQIAKKAGM
jgi:hypothetical protein